MIKCFNDKIKEYYDFLSNSDEHMNLIENQVIRFSIDENKFYVSDFIEDYENDELALLVVDKLNKLHLS